MYYSWTKTALVFPLATTLRGSADDRGTSDLPYPRKIKHCVLSAPPLLFGSFPCKVVTHYRPILPRPAVREATPRIAMTGFEALLPDGSEQRELHPFVRLA